MIAVSLMNSPQLRLSASVPRSASARSAYHPALPPSRVKRSGSSSSGWVRPAGCLLALSLLAACTPEAPAPTGPARIELGATNVLMVLMDTTRADHLGAWGYPQATSPELDRLASEGVRFSEFYANAPWTRPSIAALLTGLHPRSTGIFEEEFDVLGQELVTLAERFQAAGYLTLGLTSNPNINAWFQFDQGFDEYMDAGALWDWLPGQERVSESTASSALDAAQMTQRSLDMLDRHAASLESGPFYLQVLYIDPHRPYQAHGVAFEGPHGWYDGEIRYMDQHIGGLLSGLEQRGLLEDTLVIVTSDHGEGLDSHPGVPVSDNHGYHLFQSTLHVPLILWHPSLAPRVIEAPASSVDLLPSLAEWFQWPAAGLPGASWAAAIEGRGPAPERDFLFAETEWRQASKVAVLGDQHRLILNLDCMEFQNEGGFEGLKPLLPLLRMPRRMLYSLRDPGFEDPKRNNLWRKGDSRALGLEEALRAWEAQTPTRAPERRSAEDVRTLGDGRVVPEVEAGYAAPLEPAMQEALQALGYMGED